MDFPDRPRAPRDIHSDLRLSPPIPVSASLVNLYDAAVNVLRSVWWTATRRAHQPHRR
ncbi:MAG: hypothetical protein H6837_07520 [Planctomycetes bacterium]|nr:hypothetical protein [Planctomycetota bacterium]